MKKIHSLLVIGTLLLIVSCKKDKSDSTRMDLITTGSWKLIALTAQPGYDLDGDGHIDTDIYAFYDVCEKDNIYVFKKNGDYEVSEGASKCDASDPQVSTTHWQFTNNETQIIIDGDLGTIEELTSSTFRVSGVGQGPLQGQTITFTFGR